MSVGPKNTQSNFEVSRIDRIQNATKRIVVAYFENPLHYLFYLGLAGLMLMIAIKGKAPGQFWMIIGILTAYKIYNYFNEKQKSK